MISYSIYIIDDDPDLREVLSVALETQFKVKVFPTATSGIDAVKDDPPYAIINVAAKLVFSFIAGR